MQFECNGILVGRHEAKSCSWMSPERVPGSTKSILHDEQNWQSDHRVWEDAPFWIIIEPDRHALRFLKYCSVILKNVCGKQPRATRRPIAKVILDPDNV